MINKDTYISIEKNIVSSDHEGEKVILNINEGRYLKLNNIASKIFEICKDGISFGELVKKLSVEFNGESIVIENDCKNFFKKTSSYQVFKLSNEQ